MGVAFAQGFYLNKPMPLSDTINHYMTGSHAQNREQSKQAVVQPQ